ncbi:MAG: AAA family ATPase [Rickettsiales bacterium]|jgi:ATP-dependent Lon protease|nr:AAA family ATPase [Rickettsiales bacterium]
MKLFLLPTREMVFQPDTTLPMYLENMISVRAVDAAITASDEKLKQIVLVAQKNWNYPTNARDLYSIGTLANVMQILRMPDDTIQVMMQTTRPVRLSDIQVKDGIFSAECAPIEQTDDGKDPIVLGMRDSIMSAMTAMAARTPNQIDMKKIRLVADTYPLNAFIDAIIHAVGMETEDALEILSKRTYLEKLTFMLEKMKMKIQLSNIENDISKRVSYALANGQKEIFLRERLNEIQKALGEDDEDSSKTLKQKIEKSNIPEDVKEKAFAELKRMKNMSAYSSEAAMLRTYLEELLSMPWGRADKTEIDLEAAKAILDTDHYGMENVKERILEHLAVMKRTGSSKGTILCLVGAPGVGKTSLGQSVANALMRKYQRISLGGVSDEAHFRGHRRTYIGSQPGRIMDALKRAGTNNPVIVLDEIDKMGRDYRGDPEHALLEILDPEQNKAFRDHYLEVDFDLSNVMFIATANTLKMSPALLDRMEIIEMPNYSVDEKVEIARRHLLKNAATDTGWDINGITIGDDTIKHIINNYTNESGVRNLRRELTALLRRALYTTKCQEDSYEFTTEKVRELLNNIRPDVGRKIGFRTATPAVRL